MFLHYVTLKRTVTYQLKYISVTKCFSKIAAQKCVTSYNVIFYNADSNNYYNSFYNSLKGEWSNKGFRCEVRFLIFLSNYRFHPIEQI